MGRKALGRALAGICMLIGVLAIPGVAFAAECTSTWTGATSGEWQVAENWSPEEVPNSSDVACIPKEKTAQVVSGTNFVEMLQGEGRVAILAGSLAVMGGEQSHIQRLRVGGGALRGPGELLVTEFLHADGGSMEGAGKTVIGAEASGHVDPIEEGPGLRLTESRDLEVKGVLEVGGLGGQMNAIDGSSVEVLNTGELAVKGPEGGVALVGTSLDNSATVSVAGPAAEIRGSEGADIDNSGTLVVNAEGAGNGLPAGPAPTPKLVNTGTVLKDEGGEISLVGFKIDNEDLVEAKSGTLTFFAGGNSGQEKLDRWVSAEEAQIAFAEGAFTFGEKAAMSGTILGSQGASLKGHRFEAEEAEVWLDESSFEITGAEEESNFGFLGTTGGEIDLINKGVLAVESLSLEGKGSFDAGDKTNLTFQWSELYEGSLLQIGVGSDVDLGSFYQEEGTTTIGAGSSVESSSPYVGRGPFQIGANSDADLGWFYQEEGETTIGAGSHVEAKSPFVEQGPFEVGTNSTGHLGRLFIQEGAVTVGVGSSLDAEDTYLDVGSLDVGENVTYSIEDDFYIEEGSADVSTGATINALDGYLQAGTLSGAGNLVAKKLGWESTVMSGSGLTKVTEVGGIFGNESEFATLDQRRLITQGLFSVKDAALMMANGARLQNEAEFNASSEDPSFTAQIGIAESSTTNPRIINKSEFNKEEGTGTTTVTVPFENNGAINQFSGTLHIVNRLGVPASERFGCRGYCGDPIEVATGDFGESQTDIAVGGLGVGLELTRSYSALAAASATLPGIFGYGWFNSFGDRLDFEEEGKRITLVRVKGNTVPFTSDGKGGFDPPVWSEDTLTGNAEAGYVYKGATQIEYGFAPSGALQSVTDRNGNETTLSYTEAGKLKTIEDPSGRKITLSYNGEGLVEKAEDPMGHLVQYGYEGKELASVTMQGEEEPRWQYDYDGSHRMTTMIDGRGGEVENEYDAEGRVLSQTDPAGRTLNFLYDGFHTRYANEGTGAITDIWFNSNNQPTSITRGYGTEDATTERFTYDDSGRQLSRTDGNGHATAYTYNAAGDRTSVTDAEENKTEWAYNATHDVISETTPKGQTTTIVRDAAGNPETISQPALGETTQTISFDFDPLGQLTSLTDPLERTWSFEYDAKGNLKAEINPEGDTRSWAYDENSEVTSIVSPRGNEEGAEPGEFTTTIQRDPRGRPEKVIDPLGNDSEFAYDGNSNLESVTNARGKTTEFAYNGVDDLIETKKPNGVVVKTEYDDDGQVVGQIDGNEEKTTYVRNVLGEPIEVIDPLNRKTIQQFDDAGNLLTVIDPMERVTAYEYDDADRLEEVAYSGEATADVNFEYDADGNLTRMVDGSGESTYVYDQLGRLEEMTNGHGDTVSYEYDLAGQQEKIVYPSGKDVDRAFDDAGRLESVTDWLGKTTTFVYDADSNLEEIQFPTATGNVDEYAYDRTGQMISANFKKGAESLASIAYERDPLGQVEAMVSAGLPGPEEETYEYDDNNRLVKAGAEAFEYDNADNPTKLPGSTNAFDAASQLETGTGVAYEYNPVGERVKATPSSGPPTNYGYDQAGRLTSVKRAAEGEVPAIDKGFSFDGGGLLTSHTSGLTTRYTTWDVSVPLPLLLNDDVNSYVYGPYGLPITQIDGEEKPTYLHHDQLGSTRLLTDGAGEVSASFTYTAYGQLAAKAGTAATPLGYAGQYTDAETGLQYLRARFYDPATAQLLTRDPMEGLTGQPYAYASSNPLHYSDPTGMTAAAATGAAGCAAGPAGCAAGAAAGAAATACAASAACRDAVSEVASKAEDFVSSIFGDDASDSTEVSPRSRAEQEYDAAREVCPAERLTDLPNFDDPAQAPGAEWEWRGNGPPGSDEGAWYNPKTGESLHPDLDHPGPVDPHYDWTSPSGERFRIYPDGRVESN
ncbi:MAG TPA: RHS repeat-associated core domain-containing protein [Solirubrobacterales bacterium]|nr:RHS repeat-associated core domain-containing protein [Solirubrobacterales bacterium]